MENDTCFLIIFLLCRQVHSPVKQKHSHKVAESHSAVNKANLTQDSHTTLKYGDSLSTTSHGLALSNHSIDLPNADGSSQPLTNSLLAKIMSATISKFSQIAEKVSNEDKPSKQTTNISTLNNYGLPPRLPNADGDAEVDAEPRRRGAKSGWDLHDSQYPAHIGTIQTFIIFSHDGVLTFLRWGNKN